MLLRLSARAWLRIARFLEHRTHPKDCTAIRSQFSGKHVRDSRWIINIIIMMYSMKMVAVKPSEGGNSRKTLDSAQYFHKSLMISKIKEQVLLNFLCSLLLIFKGGKKYFPQGRGGPVHNFWIKPITISCRMKLLVTGSLNYLFTEVTGAS